MTEEEMKSILEETEILWNDRKRLERLEKENEELKAQLSSNSLQLEKMKCWANCKRSLNCSQININSTTVVRVCKNCKDWELAE